MRRPFAIALILAMLALAGIALHFRSTAVEADTRARSLARELAESRFEAKRARDRVAQLEAEAARLDSELGSAKTRTTATETRTGELSRELDAVRTTLTERQQREIALLSEIEALRQQARAAPVSSPASPASPAAAPMPSPAREDQAAYARRIAALEAQLTDLLTRALETPTNEENSLSAPVPPQAPAAAAPTHQVVRVGAKDAFVVIDFGTDHGAEAGASLTLARGTSEVARVQISDVRPRFSIAQVLPGTQKRQLQTGDIVLLAH
ncbi:MAG: hypothetical protein KBC32_06670 [Candidatus Didemnitutus sp.]|nr:hypothetical protein [Candidatus Didemnitutus sp.]